VNLEGDPADGLVIVPANQELVHLSGDR
jgi:hypothetical protein